MAVAAGGMIAPAGFGDLGWMRDAALCPSVRPVRDEPGVWEAWMVAAQAGDARAYDRLLRACLPFLRTIARRRLRDADMAEDAVQDALLSIHAMRHTWDPARPLRPWLMAIMDRRAIDAGRRITRRAGRETDIEPLAESLPDPHAAHETPMRRLQSAELRAAVAELPASQRTALNLAKIEELPLAEASARSGLSVSALKIATHRAVAKLRQRLGGSDAR
jgi:RNA polymerase sigma-70 factor (ECF subfamily)